MCTQGRFFSHSWIFISGWSEPITLPLRLLLTPGPSCWTQAGVQLPRAESLGTGQSLCTNGEELTSNSIYSHSFISMLFSPLIMVTTIMIAAFNTCHAPAPHSLFVLYFPRCFLNGPYGGNWAGTVVGFFEGLLKQCAKTETARPAESDCFLETCLTLAVFDTGLHGSWHPWQTGAVWLNLQVMQVAAAAVELNLRTMASLVQIEQHTAVLLNWIWLRILQKQWADEHFHMDYNW